MTPPETPRDAWAWPDDWRWPENPDEQAHVDLAQLAEPDHDGVLSGIVEELTAAGARIVVRRKPSWHPARVAAEDP